jgi:predicted Fe-Mo cluster-binding NifX family protein
MQIAMPTWRERISPVFDTAGRFLFVRLENGTETERYEVSVARPRMPGEAVRLLIEQDTAVLICGAISNRLVQLAEGAGIEVIPWISGPVEKVLGAYLLDDLHNPDYKMPGCCRRQRRRRNRQCRGGGPGRGRRSE